MAEEKIEPLTAAQVADLDNAYVPFPSFSDWPSDSAFISDWDQSCDEFKAAAAEASEGDLQGAKEIALRAAAFDTGAIEGLYPTNRGLTFTVAEQAAVWEQQVEAQSPDARALFEAQLRAFELVLDHVTDRMPKITQAWIRRVHEETTSAQETYAVQTPVGPQKQPLPRGEYKSHPNHVRTNDGGVHAYAPVDLTQSEMQRLVDELEGQRFKAAHPIVQASYAHYAFVAIHPFADGNGRVARALASVYTYRAASVPLLILNEHRDAYFDALAKADTGTGQPFVDFIAKVARDAVELARDSLRTAQAPQPEAILKEFDELNRVDERSKERNQIGAELFTWLGNIVLEQVEALNDSGSVKLTVQLLGGQKARAPRGYRVIPGKGASSIRIVATTVTPKKAQVNRRINVYLSDDPRLPGSFLLRAANSPHDSIDVKLVDLWPTASSLAQHRVENFVRRQLGDGLRHLHDQALGVTPS